MGELINIINMNLLCTALLASLVVALASARSIDVLEDLTIDERLAQAGGDQSAFAVFPENGTVKVDMDIIYTAEQWEEIQHARENPELFKAKNNNRYRWTNKIVPYTISSAFTSADRKQIQSAVDEWNRKTCLTLKPRTNERNYVSIVDGGGCSSMVGMVGGAQRLTLGRGCRYHATIVHEFGHAIGFEHEHQRPERDSYISINMQNVIDGYKFAFNKYSHVSSHGVGYDYGSVMHYGQTAFSKNRRVTIQTKDPYWQNRIGRAPGLAESDVKLAKIIYNCNGDSGSGGNNENGGNGGTGGVADCVNYDNQCDGWAARGECERNRWMIPNCRKACKKCHPKTCTNVHPDDAQCQRWAYNDECVKNPYWMSRNCALACNTC